jgi:hypothetical protein
MHRLCDGGRRKIQEEWFGGKRVGCIYTILRRIRSYMYFVLSAVVVWILKDFFIHLRFVHNCRAGLTFDKEKL